MDYSFQEANGARALSKGHPRVAVVMTDGRSDEQLTKDAAARAHNASINMIAIGVGTNLPTNELVAIASDPKYLNLFYLGFSHIDILFYDIQRRTCEGRPTFPSQICLLICYYVQYPNP